MFRDREEALKRLEAELLAEEKEKSLDELLEDFLNEEDDDDILFEEDDFEILSHETRYRNFSNNYGRNVPNYSAYNSDRSDEDLDAYSDEVHHGSDPGIRKLVVTAMLLSTGIVAMMLFWYIRYFS